MSSQPEYIRKVALIGATGRIGSYFLKHLLATNKHTITILTRTTSTAQIPPHPNQQIAKVDYSSETSLVSALRGNDFLIITLGVLAPPTQHADIISAAKKAGVPYVMPNSYGWGGSASAAFAKDPILGRFSQVLDAVRAVEVDYVALACGFWYEFSLGMGTQWYGFDIPNRSVTFYDDGMQKINTTTWEQCGRAVAALLSLPVEKQADGSLSLADRVNQGLIVSSFRVSQRDMLDSLNRVLGTTDGDWKIEYEDVQERYKNGMEELQGGNRLGFAKAMYARVFFKSAEGDYENEIDNEGLGLPKEELDEATKRAVGWVEDGTLGVKAT